MSFLRRSNQSLIQSIRQLTITVSPKNTVWTARDGTSNERNSSEFMTIFQVPSLVVHTVLNHLSPRLLTGFLECCTDESWECRPNCRSRRRTKHCPGKYQLYFSKLSTFIIYKSRNIRQWVDSALWLFYTGVTLTRQHILTAIQPENLSWVILWRHLLLRNKMLRSVYRSMVQLHNEFLGNTENSRQKWSCSIIGRSY